MATKYRVDLGQAPDPQMANPALLQRAKQLEGAATSATIEAVGGSIWEGYKGYQQAGLSEELTGEVNRIQKEMTDLKSADTANKASLEADSRAIPKVIDSFRAATLLAGADPDEAKTLSTVFGQQSEDAAVARFREEQQRIIAARDAMPERQHEFMQRSEQILKKYIAQIPGLANNFRQVAAEVTGKEHLDLYSVQRLYSDVDYIEKQRQQAAKNAEAANLKLMDAYVDDRVKGGASKTQAIAEFNAVTPEQRLELAQASVEANNAATASKDALKQGGNAILNISSLARSQFENTLITSNASVYARIQQLGVSRQQLASGAIPDAIANSPEYKKLIDEAGTKTLELLDVMYKDGLDALQAKLKSNPADAGDVNKAIGELQTWYDDRRKYYSENKTSFLVGTATNDPTKTVQQRLNVVESLHRSLGLPPEVVADLGMTGDKKGYSDARAKYPQSAAAIDAINELRQLAISGVSDDKWVSALQSVKLYGSGDLSIPKDKVSSVGSFVSHAQLGEKVKKAALSGATPTTTQDVASYVSMSFVSPANAEQFMSKGVGSFEAAYAKIPESERNSVNTQIKQSATLTIYGETGHGNAAKAKYDEFVAGAATIPGSNSFSTMFSDPTGTRPLRITINRIPRDGMTQQERLQFDRFNKTAPQPNAVNGVLASVDTMLRIQAMTTKTPIEKLRKEFIESFVPEGRVSDNYTAKFAEAAVKASQEVPATTPATSNTTSQWWKQ